MTAELLLTLSFLVGPAPEAEPPLDDLDDPTSQEDGVDDVGADDAADSDADADLADADSASAELEGDVASDADSADAVYDADAVDDADAPADGEPQELEGPEPEVGELDMGDIFGDGSALEDMEELPADGGDEADAGGGIASKLPGEISFEFGLLTSVYVDFDNLADGPGGDPKRWTKAYGRQRGGISRQENRLEFYVNYRPTEHLELVGGVEPVFMGFSDASTLDDLSSRQMIKPFHMESDRAYVGLIDIAPGLDIKVGRQIVVWGTADKFNPTNNINPDDLEDRPLFTEPIANQMAVIDYSAFEDKLQLQAIWVPVFYPALLPPSASDALTDPKAPIPFSDDGNLGDLVFLQDYLDSNPRFVPTVSSQVVTPTPSLRNGQGAFKIGSKMGDVDMSASYFFGFHDIPLPYYATAGTTYPEDEFLDQQPAEEGCCFESTAYLRYPGMHVIGADMATQLPWLGNMGFWAEGAMFLPTQRNEMTIEIPVVINLPSTDGIDQSLTGLTADNRPFFKVTTGVDYTAGKHVLLLAQYMRGFIDEFGAGNIGNYVMGGTQLAFRGRHVIAQLFGVVSLPRKRELGTDADSGRDLDALWNGDTVSGVIAPELALVPKWGYLTFKMGAFALLGKSQSKFGQKATGSSIAYLKMQGRF